MQAAGFKSLFSVTGLIPLVVMTVRFLSSASFKDTDNCFQVGPPQEMKEIWPLKFSNLKVPLCDAEKTVAEIHVPRFILGTRALIGS